MGSLKRKIRKNVVYRLGDVISMFFRFGTLRSYKLFFSNHKAQKSGLQYFVELGGAKVKVNKIVLVRLLTLMAMHLIQIRF